MLEIEGGDKVAVVAVTDQTNEGRHSTEPTAGAIAKSRILCGNVKICFLNSNFQLHPITLR